MRAFATAVLLNVWSIFCGGCDTPGTVEVLSRAIMQDPMCSTSDILIFDDIDCGAMAVKICFTGAGTDLLSNHTYPNPPGGNWDSAALGYLTGNVTGNLQNNAGTCTVNFGVGQGCMGFGGCAVNVLTLN